MKHSDHIEAIRKDGVSILRSVFTQEEIASARERVLDNLAYMSNTRPTPSARHLAGFHRFPRFEDLHLLLTQREAIASLMQELCGRDARTIGLTDITVNRSQPWHKDLLRGDYAAFLSESLSWESDCASVYKVLLYLQDSSSLKFLPGSHLAQSALDSDQHAVPLQDDEVRSVTVSAGDVAIIDIRLTHRGSSEEAFAAPESERFPKILISTVYGGSNCPFADAMEIGNAKRTADWTRKHMSVDKFPQ